MTKPRIIVLTGVTRGLGRALLDRFEELGHVVHGCGRSEDKIAELQTEFDRRHSFSVVDVNDHAAVQHWANQLIQQGNVPELLINNAALMNRNNLLWDIPVEEFSDVIDVNIKGVFHVIRAFAPAMIERSDGVIVNLSSGWGRSSSAEVAPYCATKWAVEGLTQALAQELPVGMAAIPVNPGIINTDMLQSCFAESANHYPSADQWSVKAAPFLLSLDSQHNGTQQTVPM